MPSRFTPHDVNRFKQILARGQVPQKYARMRLTNEAAVNYAPRIQSYIDGLSQSIHDGDGLYLHGPPLSGKTAAACIIMKHAVVRNYSVLLVEAEEARRASVTREMFDADTPLWDRMQGVGVLTILHFGQERRVDEFKAAFASLVRYRSARGRVTLITSYITPDRVALEYGEEIAAAIGKTSHPLSFATEADDEDDRG
jgi:DNA replication protein DnaC